MKSPTDVSVTHTEGESSYSLASTIGDQELLKAIDSVLQKFREAPKRAVYSALSHDQIFTVVGDQVFDTDGSEPIFLIVEGRWHRQGRQGEAVYAQVGRFVYPLPLGPNPRPVFYERDIEPAGQPAQNTRNKS